MAPGEGRVELSVPPDRGCKVQIASAIRGMLRAVHRMWHIPMPVGILGIKHSHVLRP